MSVFGFGSSGATDAVAGVRDDIQACPGDRVPALLARPERARIESAEGLTNFGQDVFLGTQDGEGDAIFRLPGYGVGVVSGNSIRIDGVSPNGS